MRCHCSTDGFLKTPEFFCPLSQKCDCSVAAQQIFAAFDEFMSASDSFQRGDMSREDGTPRWASKMADFQQVVGYLWLLHPLGIRPQVLQEQNIIATGRYSSVLCQDCTSTAQISTVVSDQEINLDYKEGRQQGKTDPCFDFWFAQPKYLAWERREQNEAEGQESRAVSLWNCTHRFRSSCIQLPCSFPDITVFSNSQQHCICPYLHSLFLPQQLNLSSSTLSRDCVLRDEAAIHRSCGLSVHKDLCNVPKIT